MGRGAAHLIVENVTSAWFGRGKVTFWMLPKREHSLRILESVITCGWYLRCPFVHEIYRLLGPLFGVQADMTTVRLSAVHSLCLFGAPTGTQSAASYANRCRVYGIASCPRRVLACSGRLASQTQLTA